MYHKNGNFFLNGVQNVYNKFLLLWFFGVVRQLLFVAAPKKENTVLCQHLRSERNRSTRHRSSR